MYILPDKFIRVSDRRGSSRKTDSIPMEIKMIHMTLEGEWKKYTKTEYPILILIYIKSCLKTETDSHFKTAAFFYTNVFYLFTRIPIA